MNVKSVSASCRRTLFLVAVLLVAGCGGGGSKEHPAADLTGSWKFILNEHPEEADESDGRLTEIGSVRLEQVGNELSGEYETFSFEGVIDGDSVSLTGYHRESDGDLHETIQMDLRVVSPDLLEGEGMTDAGSSKSDDPSELFTVRAERQAADSNEVVTKSFADTVCSLAGDIASFITGKLTDNMFRPMGGCWLQKDGGGYYVFGRKGPGSMLPVYTQTVYQPIEWAACSTRSYKFTIKSGKPVWSLAVLTQLLQTYEKMLQNSGLGGLASALQQITDFYNKFGDFAISVARNSETGNISLYINLAHSKSESEVRSHPLISGVYNALNHMGKVYFFTGTKIKDSFKLRRSPSPVGVCNSPLVIYYLLGNLEVEYD